MREKAHQKISDTHKMQKKYYDKRRKESQKYKLGDLVLVEKQPITPGSSGSSKKLIHPFSGRMMVTEVIILAIDRYRISDMELNTRTTRWTNYDRVVAADKLKSWRKPDVLSDEDTQ